MARIFLDCLGLPCPQPVLLVKDALDQGADTIEVLVDNEASKNNVIRFARSQGHTITSTARAEGGHLLVLKASANAPAQSVDPETFRCEPGAGGMVYVISSDSMGRGSDELGWALLQTYIQTIKDIQPLPATILLYNSGVRLVAVPSGALDALQHLQAQGVEILACGTCLDFYQLKSAILVGQITNMYEIMNIMARAEKIVSPY